jgi:hypothetical protein
MGMDSAFVAKLQTLKVAHFNLHTEGIFVKMRTKYGSLMLQPMTYYLNVQVLYTQYYQVTE